jgi:hypothetical protein
LSYGAVLQVQLGRAQDKKGNPTGKLEFQAGVILFRPTTKETKGKRKFIQEYEELANDSEDVEEDTKLERIGQVLIFLNFLELKKYFCDYSRVFA